MPNLARKVDAHPLPRPERRGLNREQAADYFGVSPSTLDKMIKDGKAPRPIPIYGRWVYDLIDCEKAFNRLKSQSEEPDNDGWDDYQ